jgi:hypothetical protein
LPEIISNTSPLQYLHQLGVLNVLPNLVTTVTVPPAVEEELAAGRALGLNLPDLQNLGWITVRRPSSSVALPLVTDLGPGEREVPRWPWKPRILFVFLTMPWRVRLQGLCSFVSLGLSES